MKLRCLNEMVAVAKGFQVGHIVALRDWKIR
jgi:hypothetical protein